MNDALNSLFGQLKESSGASKAVALLVGAAVLGLFAVAAVVSNRPHFQLAFSGLSDHEIARVNKALSEAGIPFDVSQPPAPFNVYVDGDSRSRAYMAVYGAGALDKPLKGIIADSGMASVFQGSEERQQAVRKRDWQEMEGILEALDFVASARIRTSPTDGSPFARPGERPVTASVTLRVMGEGELEAEQTRTVANLVSRGLGIAEEDLVISDQDGRSLFDGSDLEEKETGTRDLLSIKSDYDKRASETANSLLAETLGPGRARVTVSSEWDFEQTTRSQTTSSKGGVLSETKNSEETPLPGSRPAVGGPAGLSANVTDAGEQETPESPAEAAPAEPLVSRVEEQKKEYQPSVTTVQSVRTLPVLKRLTVAAFFDESIETERVRELEEAIKAAVGFDAQSRADEFRAVRVPFASAAEPAEPTAEDPAQAAPEESGPSPWTEILLRRGVEIASAAVFLILLVGSLRRSKRSNAESAVRTAAADAGADVDPEALARAHVEELLSSDPERVGEILSSWAREEKSEVGASP